MVPGQCRTQVIDSCLGIGRRIPAFFERIGSETCVPDYGWRPRLAGSQADWRRAAQGNAGVGGRRRGPRFRAAFCTRGVSPGRLQPCRAEETRRRLRAALHTGAGDPRRQAAAVAAAASCPAPPPTARHGPPAKPRNIRSRRPRPATNCGAAGPGVRSHPSCPSLRRREARHGACAPRRAPPPPITPPPPHGAGAPPRLGRCPGDLVVEPVVIYP